MKMKKSLVFICLLLIAVILTACGKTVVVSDESLTPIDGRETVLIELAPDVDSYQAIDADTLNVVRSILETRLAGAEVDGFNVSPNGENIVVTYPRNEKEKVTGDLLTQVGRLSICNSDGDVVLDNDDVASATANVNTAMGDDYVQYVVLISFNDEGTEKFRKLTEDCLNQETAIYIDDELICSPMIQAVITDGEALITGDFTAEEAERIAMLINAAALPFPLTVIHSSEGDVDKA